MALNRDATLILKVHEILMRENKDLSSRDGVTTPIKERSKDDNEIDANEVEPLKLSVECCLNDQYSTNVVRKKTKTKTIVKEKKL
nr:uncharacterized protein LOC109184097 [Ipomoea trifida]